MITWESNNDIEVRHMLRQLWKVQRLWMCL